MDLQLLAYCGLYCGACSFKLAHETRDPEHLRRMPGRYDPYKALPPEPCPGCRLENQCGPCRIRDCARERGLEHCGACPDFPCPRLEAFTRDGAPHHAQAVTNLEAVNRLGPAAWLEEQAARWTGPCGCRQSWYLRECRGGHGRSGILRDLREPADLEQAARLAAGEHAALRRDLPFLPAREPAHYLPRLDWIARHGALLGLVADGALRAFLGGFILEDFRHAGRGALSPDWCHGAEPGVEADAAHRLLYRALAARWVEAGARVHAVGCYAGARATLRAFALTGFGHIVLDAARPTEDLVRDLEAADRPALQVRRATLADAPVLAAFNAALADHLGAPPVFFPRPAGADAARWRAWFGEPEAVAFLALLDGAPVGYLRAQEPQEDVTDAVHGPGTLAINGAFVLPGRRSGGIGRTLLLALARHARDRGRNLVSVDCETANPEALGFWGRWLRPVTWSLERRV